MKVGPENAGDPIWGLRINGGWSPSNGNYGFEVDQISNRHGHSKGSSTYTEYLQVGSGKLEDGSVGGWGGIWDSEGSGSGLIFKATGSAGGNSDVKVKIGDVKDDTDITATGDGNNTYILIDDENQNIKLNSNTVEITKGAIITSTYYDATFNFIELTSETSQGESASHLVIKNTNGEATDFIIGGKIYSSHGYKDVKPADTATYDLGSPSLRWDNVYTTDLQLSNMDKKEGNIVDGTKGNWTLQEGEEDLFVINNLSGKKYKIALIPTEED
jgi:hypothetical protein